MFIYHLTHFGDVILMVYTHIVSGDYACNYGNITKCLGRPVFEFERDSPYQLLLLRHFLQGNVGSL